MSYYDCKGCHYLYWDRNDGWECRADCFGTLETHPGRSYPGRTLDCLRLEAKKSASCGASDLGCEGGGGDD
jgi:hypothetical protein